MKAATALVNPVSVVEEVKDEQGIQAFLQAISKQGAIRVKRESNPSDTDSVAETSEATDDLSSVDSSRIDRTSIIDESLSSQQTTEDGQAGESIGDVEDVDNDAAEDKAAGDIDDSVPAGQMGDVLSTEKEGPTPVLAPEWISMVLVETMRGIVGQRDWRSIRWFNVQRFLYILHYDQCDNQLRCLFPQLEYLDWRTSRL